MAKLTLTDLATTLSNSAALAINVNNGLTEAALENTLSRDGTSPNQMGADLDLNNNDLLNVKSIDTQALYIDGELIVPPDAVNVGNFATAAQGAKADTAMQPTMYDPTGVHADAFNRANHTGTEQFSDLDTTVLDPLLTPFFRNTYKKRVRLDLPMQPTGYATALTASAPATYLYPQAFCIDSATNQMFTVFVPNAGTAPNWVVVEDWTTGAFISSFFAGIGTGGIGITKKAGSRFLWARAASNFISKYDITVLPTNLSTPAPVSSTDVNLYLFLTTRGADQLLISEAEPPSGTNRLTSRFVRMDDTLTRHETIKFSIWDTGDNNAYFDYLPHLQAPALMSGYIAASYGTIYTSGAVTPPKVQGWRIFSGAGERLAEAMFDPSICMTLFTAAGYSNTRLENEGCAVDSQDRLYTLNVLLDVSDIAASTRGRLIVEEAAQGEGVLDFRSAVYQLSTTNLDKLNTRVRLLRHPSNKLFNPITGAEFLTVTDIQAFMTAAEVSEVTYFSSNTTILDANGVAMPANADIEIHSLNNSSFFFSATSTAVESKYLVAAGPVQTTLYENFRRAGSPVGAVSATVIGATCVDFTNGNFWIATAAGTGGWQRIPQNYVETTFTPAISGTTAAGAGTYTTQSGIYTRVGRMITCQATLVWTAHTGTGNMKITGLPVAASASTALAVPSLYYSNLTFAGPVSGYVSASGTEIILETMATGAASTALPIDAAATVRFTLTYMV